MSLRKRWRALVAEHGSRSVATLYVLHRVLQRLSGSRARLVPYAFYAQPVGGAWLDSVRDDPSSPIRQVRQGDEVVSEFPRTLAVNELRFASGAECFAATHRGSFAGHIWLAHGSYVEDEVRCTYLLSDPETNVWDFDVFVRPELRLGRTMGRLWKAVDRHLASNGVRWTHSRISLFNGASIRSHERLGAVRTGWACFLDVGGWQLTFGSAAPRLHLSRPHGEGPVLTLHPPH